MQREILSNEMIYEREGVPSQSLGKYEAPKIEQREKLSNIAATIGSHTPITPT